MKLFKYRILQRNNAIMRTYRIEKKPIGFFSFLYAWEFVATGIETLEEAHAKVSHHIKLDKQPDYIFYQEVNPHAK